MPSNLGQGGTASKRFKTTEETAGNEETDSGKYIVHCYYYNNTICQSYVSMTLETCYQLYAYTDIANERQNQCQPKIVLKN